MRRYVLTIAGCLIVLGGAFALIGGARGRARHRRSSSA